MIQLAQKSTEVHKYNARRNKNGRGIQADTVSSSSDFAQRAVYMGLQVESFYNATGLRPKSTFTKFYIQGPLPRFLRLMGGFFEAKRPSERLT